MYSRLFLLFVFFSNLIHANTLQQSYFFTSPTITSSDLNTQCPKNFEIVLIPDGKTSYRMNAQIILKTFELNGCQIDGGKTRYVNFTKRSNTDYAQLQEQISTYFLTNYPTMTIHSIQIIAHGYIDSLPNTPHVVLDKDSYAKNKGTFYVVDGNGIRHYFEYLVDASLTVLHSTQKTSRKEPLSSTNTALKSIAFTSFRGKPLASIPEKSYRFCSTLQANTPITDHQIEASPIILRNAKVSVQVRNDSVIVEFIATAMQEGALYDIITIEKADKKRVRAKIIGDNTVELQ
jgi:flagella basal body P-ring formation protein FlgA